MRFKVGDRVRIVHISEGHMIKFKNGNVGIVKEVKKISGIVFYYIKVNGFDTLGCFTPDEIEKLPHKNEQLTFDFVK